MIVNFLRGVGGGVAGGLLNVFQVQCFIVIKVDKFKLLEVNFEICMLIDGKLVEVENGVIFNNINLVMEEVIGVVVDVICVDM